MGTKVEAAGDGWMGRLRLGEPRRAGALEIVPLLRDGDGGPPGVLLSGQAVEAGLLEIVEQGEGVVQELLARNKGDVDRELAASGAASRTCDYYEIVKREGGDAHERAAAIAPEPGQVGAIVLADGAFVGLEAAGHHALWSAMAHATLASDLMGSRRGGPAPRGARGTPAEWLARVQAARVTTAPGLGLGQDLDVEGPGLAGVGIALGPLAVHLAVFPC